MATTDPEPSVLSGCWKKWEFGRSEKRFVERLGGGPFLMGDTMTIADIIAAHCGHWAIGAKFPINEPGFRSYIDRLSARPAFKRAFEKSA